MQSLHQLSKVALTPTRLSNTAAPLSFLETIDHIEINSATECNFVVYYQLDVFLKHRSSHIPTVKATTCGEQSDYRLHKRFSDFANLRYEVWFHAQRRHEDGNCCKYCNDFMSYIVGAMAQPRLVVKLMTGVNTRKELLAKFCNSFIKKSLDNKTEVRICSGYQSIPRIVERFFTL